MIYTGIQGEQGKGHKIYFKKVQYLKAFFFL